VAQTSNDETLLPAVAELASGKNFAAVATVFPSGLIQNQIMWVGLRDGKIVLNTETHRKRFRNLGRDPRITVLIRDEQDPHRYAEVRGEVSESITGPEARAHIDELARKYGGSDFPSQAIKSERVILVITPHRQAVIDQNIDTSD
jgi:PPOX class probable F420-dependent enzyme